MKKTILFIAAILISAMNLYAQQLRVYNVNPFGYPVTKANFYAFDENGEMLFDISPTDFKIVEDGVEAEALSVFCSEGGICKGEKFSAVLAIDISGSTKDRALPEEKRAAEIFIDNLPDDGSECAIVAFNHDNFLANDFSTDRTQLKKSFESLTSGGGTDFNAALIDPLAGALLIAEKGKYAKRIILVTDGLSDGDEDAIIAKANELDAKIFAVIIGNQVPEVIQAITAMTGGFYFAGVTAENAAIIFKQLSGVSSCSGGCEITWKSIPTCDSRRETEFTYLPNSSKDVEKYAAYSKSRVLTTVSPKSFIYEREPIGSHIDDVFTITNQYHPVTITNINDTDPAFKVIDYGGSAPPFEMGTGENRTITVRYKAQVDEPENGQIIIEKNYCGDETITFLSYDPLPPDSIIVVSPNGGEKYLAGSDTTITWKGNTTDTVTIEYSIDGGKTWNFITNEASGLSYNWKVPGAPSDSCLVRIFREDNPQHLIDGQIFGYGTVNCLDISPDGTKLVSASGSGCLYIWDLFTFKVIDTIYREGKGFEDIKWCPDGKKIASLRWNEKACEIWDLESDIEHIQLENYSKNIQFSISWNPESKKIAGGSYDGSIVIWDIETGTIVDTLLGHLEDVNSLEWSPDGKFIASGSYDKTIKIWDVDSGIEIMTLEDHDGLVSSVRWSPDGTRIASGSSDKTLKIWDVGTGMVLKTMEHDRYVSSVAWSPDGTRIASSSRDSTVKIWDAVTGTELMTLKEDNIILYFDNWIPDGTKIVISSSDGTIKILDADSGTKIKTLEGHAHLISSVGWSPDGTRIASGHDDGTINIWEPTTQSNLITLKGHINRVSSLSWNPSGDKIASCGWDSKIKIWGIKTGTLIRIINDFSGVVFDLNWSPDGNYIAASSNKRILIFDTENFNVSFEVICDPVRLAWSPESMRLARVEKKDTSITIWDLESEKDIINFNGHVRSSGISWSPDGKKMACGAWDNITPLNIWDILKEELLTTINSAGCSSLAWSPDGKFIANGSHNFVEIWDANDYKLIKLTPRYSSSGLAVSWHPNSKWITCGGFEGAIRIFRVVDIKPDTSDSFFSIVVPKLAAEDMDMLQHCAASVEPKEITKENYITNNEEFDVRIDSIKISGTNAADFKVFTQALPFTLKPNESMTVKFRFHPQTPGMKTANVDVYHQFGVLTMIITGEALDCNIKTIETSFNLAEVCIGSKTDTLAAVMVNTGAVPSQIDSTVVLGPDFDQFELISGGGSFAIAPGDTHNIQVEYIPVSEGVSTCRYAFYHAGISSPEIITFQAEGVKCELKAGYDQEFELINPCDELNYVEKKVKTIINKTRAEAQIDSLVFEPDDGIFSIMDNLTYPFLMQDNEEKDLTIRFTPTDTGRICRILKIYYNDPTSPKEMEFCGFYGIYDWSVEQDTIKVYDVQEGEQKEVTYQIINTGNMPLYWNNPPIKFGSGRFVITSIDPNPTPGKDSSEVTVQFTGDSVSFKGEYYFKNKCELEDSITVYSLRDQVYELVLRTDTLQAKPGEIIQVPIYLTLPATDLYDVSDGLYTELSFNVTLMDNISNNDNIMSESYSQEGMYLEKHLSLLLPKNIFLGEKFLIEFKVGLGNSDTTDIIFNNDSTYISGFQIAGNIETNNGLLALDICREGGDRLVTVGSEQVAILNIIPHPVNENADIELYLLEEGHTSLILYNSIGEALKTVYEGNPESTGFFSTSINTNNLSSGIYLLVLKTPTQLSNRMMVISK